MSKKSKYFKKLYETDSKKDTKKKKNKKSAYEAPKLKRVKATLDKDDAKQLKKIVVKPIDIDPKFSKKRAQCNHAVSEEMTPEQFKAMTPNYAAFTPMLDAAIDTFGEKNVGVCPRCFDVMVAAEQIDSDMMKTSIVTLYAAANMVLSHKRLKDDEIKDISKLKDALGKWNKVIDLMEEIEAAGVAAETATVTPSTTVDEDALARMSRNNGQAVVY